MEINGCWLADARYTPNPFDTADSNRCPISGWLLFAMQPLFRDRTIWYAMLDPLSGKTNDVLRLYDAPEKDSTTPGRRTGGAT